MLSFFPRGVLDEILNLIESVSELLDVYHGKQQHNNNNNFTFECIIVHLSALSETALSLFDLWLPLIRLGKQYTSVCYVTIRLIKPVSKY